MNETIPKTTQPMPVLSASRTHLVLTCNLAARLPWEEREAGPAAKVGTRFHALVEKPILAREWVALDELDASFEPALRTTLAWFSEQVTDGEEILTEQAYELKPLGGYVHEPGKREPHWRDRMVSTRLPRADHRSYPASDASFFGTADVVILGKGAAHVIDWKTGRRSDDHLAQLKSLALMVAEAEHVNHVKATAVYVNLDTGKLKAESVMLDSFDLHVHAGQLVSLFQNRVNAGALPDPVPGKQCFFCPAVGCPEKLRTR